jgi:hypothetical protein
MMTVEEKPDITYSDIGGCKEQIEKMREVVELPMLHPEKFVRLGIDPPKVSLLVLKQWSCPEQGNFWSPSVCLLYSAYRHHIEKKKKSRASSVRTPQFRHH